MKYKLSWMVALSFVVAANCSYASNSSTGGPNPDDGTPSDFQTGLSGTTHVLFWPTIFGPTSTTKASGHTSRENNRALLIAAEDDASAFLAGQEKSALLSLIMDHSREVAAEKYGKDFASKIEDRDIAFQVIEDVEKLKD